MGSLVPSAGDTTVDISPASATCFLNLSTYAIQGTTLAPKSPDFQTTTIAFPQWSEGLTLSRSSLCTIAFPQYTGGSPLSRSCWLKLPSHINLMGPYLARAAAYHCLPTVCWWVSTLVGATLLLSLLGGLSIRGWLGHRSCRLEASCDVDERIVILYRLRRPIQTTSWFKRHREPYAHSDILP